MEGGWSSLWNPLKGLSGVIGRGIAHGRAARVRDRSIMTYPQLSSSSVPLPPQNGTQEPDELTKFRDDWKHEVGLHHRAERTREPSADTVPPLDGLPDVQHYSAGEPLAQAQDSFVRL